MSIADAGLSSAKAERELNKKPTPVFPKQTRQCLKCHQDFQSEGPSNRVCDKCNQINLRYGRRSGSETSSGYRVSNTTVRQG